MNKNRLYERCHLCSKEYPTRESLTNHIKSHTMEKSKKSKKNKKDIADSSKKSNRPSAFTKPLSLSQELTSFLGVDKNTKMSRPQVVKEVWNYLKSHNLQDENNKQWFTPDERMSTIFGKDKIRAFGMTKYLKDHFI